MDQEHCRVELTYKQHIKHDTVVLLIRRTPIRSIYTGTLELSDHRRRMALGE